MTSPSAYTASTGETLAATTSTVKGSQCPDIQHTAAIQDSRTTATTKSGDPNDLTIRAEIKQEPLQGDGLESQTSDGVYRDQAVANTEQSALPPQPHIGLDGLELTSGMDLAILAAYANPIMQLDMLEDADSDVAYYPPPTMPGINPLSMPVAVSVAPFDGLSYLSSAPYIPEQGRQEPTRISAYAKLVFDDGEFYMNTYSVILGRDIAAWRTAMRQEKERQDSVANRQDHSTPVRIKHEGSRYTRSIVSEKGGILRHGNDSDPDDRVRKRRLRKGSRSSRKSRSERSSSVQPSRKNSLDQGVAFQTYQPQRLQSRVPETEGIPTVDPATFRPSPHDCPLVAIHPPASAPLSAYKSISRQHVKIAFNSRKSLFEAIILGRNGCFIEDEWYHPHDVVPLESGSSLQIGGITVRFMLPSQLDPQTTQQHEDYDEEPTLDRYSEGGKEMSLEFTDERREGALGGTSDDDSNEPEARSIGKERNSEDSDGADGEKGDIGEEEEGEEDIGIDDSPGAAEDEDEKTQASTKPIKIHLQLKLPPEKKRGPGRPPKNGIMSKREEKQVKKEEQARLEALANKGKTAQAQAPQVDQVSNEKSPAQPTPVLPIKNKVGRPRKHPLPEIPSGPPREKRKYTKRKPKEPKEGKEGEGKGSGSGSEGGSKPKKEKNPPRPPRSPSPIMKEEDYTPEQLAKPNHNYVVLIHEALSNAPKQELSLPDIYRAIYRRYPYFKLKTQTVGWQSSVRHNLSQHASFRKVEKDGKGWTWGIVDGVSIEKEKKRRATPPPMHHGQTSHPPLYPGHPMMGYGPPPPGYMIPPNMPSGQYAPYMMPLPMNSHPPPPTHMNGNLPPHPYPHMTAPSPSFPATAKIASQIAATAPTTYSSPYAPKPPERLISTPAASTTRPKSLATEQLNDAQKSAPADEPNTPQINSAVAQPLSHSQSALPSPNPEVSVPAQTYAQERQIPSSQAQQQHSEDQTRQPSLQPQVSLSPSKSADNLITEAPSGNQVTKSQSLQTQAMPLLHNQVQAQQQPATTQASSTKPNGVNTDAVKEKVLSSAKSFGNTMIRGMKDITSDAEAIVNSAIDRVLGNTTQSAVPGNVHEDKIIDALKALLSNIEGSGIKAPGPSFAKTFMSTEEAYQNASSQPPLNHKRPFVHQQPAQSSAFDKSIHTVVRPAFAAQGRSVGLPVSRPPVTAPLPKRTNSEGQMYVPPPSNAASISPASLADEVDTAKTPSSDNGQAVTGQKRSHDGTDETREFKRLSTSRPPSLKT